MGCSRPDARLAELVVMISVGGCYWHTRVAGMVDLVAGTVEILALGPVPVATLPARAPVPRSCREAVAHVAAVVSMQKRPMPAGATLRRAFFGALAFHPPPC